MSIIENFKCLVIDDMASARAMIEQSLIEIDNSVHVDQAESILQARRLIESKKRLLANYDLILCDWEMPEGPGIDLLKWFKESKISEKTCFMMLTTVTEVERVLQAIQIGSDGYIVKPFRPNDLLKKINEALEKKVGKK